MRNNKMLKSLLITLTLLICGTLSAQTSMAHRKGYSGNFSAGCHIPLYELGSQGEIHTTHGYAFGDGSFLGVGTGLMINLWGAGQVPVYLKWSHTFDTKTIDPYISASVGIIGNEYLSFSHYVTPEAGFMIKNWFFYTRFSYYRYTDGADHETDKHIFTQYPALSFGVGISW